MLEAKNIERFFINGDIKTEVLRGIDFVVPRGQFVSVVGPSGAGKSTLLYQLALLDTPNSGQIIFEEQDVTHLNQAQASCFRLQNFGFVFQEYALVPELTVTENIVVPMLMRGEEKNVAEKVAHQILTRLDLDHAFDKLPSRLSGGEQQRVSVARAVAGKPKILFADEPTANLDSERSLDVLKTLDDLNREGQTIVMITHEIEYARMADRIVELRDGKVVSDKILKNHN